MILGLIAAAGVAVGALAVGGDRPSNPTPVLVTTTTTPDVGRTETLPTTSTTSPASASTSPLANVRGKVIVIDPGHNGGNYLHSAEINRQVNAGTLWKACDTTGTATNDGYTEAAYTFAVAQRLQKILRRVGARVIMTRTDNKSWGPCITERAAIGNRARGDIAISIHADGGPASGRGFHVIYAPSIKGLTDDIYKDSRRLALAIRASFPATGMPRANYVGTDGLNVRSDLGGLNLSDVPKVLFETGNMRNATDAALFKSVQFRQRAALAIARGFNLFLAKS